MPRKGSTKATGRDYTYDKKYQATEERKRYRAELNKEARERGIYGKREKMGKDLSHTKNGKMVLESNSFNRGRQGCINKSTKS